jgi:hypothetical protein
MPDLRPDKNGGKKFFNPQVCPDKKRANFGKMPDVKIRMKIAAVGERLRFFRIKSDLDRDTFVSAETFGTNEGPLKFRT